MSIGWMAGGWFMQFTAEMHTAIYVSDAEIGCRDLTLALAITLTLALTLTPHPHPHPHPPPSPPPHPAGLWM